MIIHTCLKPLCLPFFHQNGFKWINLWIHISNCKAIFTNIILFSDTEKQKESWETRGKVDPNLEIPLLMQNKVPDGYETDDRLDVSLRPDEVCCRLQVFIYFFLKFVLKFICFQNNPLYRFIYTFTLLFGSASAPSLTSFVWKDHCLQYCDTAFKYHTQNVLHRY